MRLSRAILNRRNVDELPTVILRVGPDAPSIDIRGKFDSFSQFDKLPENGFRCLKVKAVKFTMFHRNR